MLPGDVVLALKTRTAVGPNSGVSADVEVSGDAAEVVAAGFDWMADVVGDGLFASPDEQPTSAKKSVNEIAPKGTVRPCPTWGIVIHFRDR
jgi:hypothetical protein